MKNVFILLLNIPPLHFFNLKRIYQNLMIAPHLINKNYTKKLKCA